MKDILLVCATQSTRAEFRKSATLAASIKKLQAASERVTSRIIFQNREGLGVIYNRFLKSRYASKIVVFVHDDVGIEDLFFVEKLNAAIETFDVIGLAGNQTPDLAHPSWFDQRQPLAGFVAHPWPEQPGRRDPQTVIVSSYGPTPSSCGLLDGCFLAVNTEKAVAAECRFDEQFDFHFYDLDFCRTCVERGLKLGTWPIWIVHQSGGSFGSAAWRRAARLYQRKWNGNRPGPS